MAGTQLRRIDLRGISTDCGCNAKIKKSCRRSIRFCGQVRSTQSPLATLLQKVFAQKISFKKMKKIKIGYCKSQIDGVYFIK